MGRRGLNIPIALEDGNITRWIIETAMDQYNPRIFRAQLAEDPSLLPDVTNRPMYLDWLHRKLDGIELAADLLRDTDTKIVICQFQPFGGVYYTLRNKPRFEIFRNQQYRMYFYEDWAMIAARFRDHPNILGYDILNEPLHPKTKKVMPILINAAKAIRRHTQEQKVIFSTPFGHVTKINTMKRFVDQMKNLKNAWVTVHMYWPMKITHQGIPIGNCHFRYPLGKALYPTGRLNKGRLKSYLQPVKDFQKTYRIPIFIGEFSCSRWSGHPHSNNSFNYLKDVTEIMNEFSWHWAYHAYNDAGVWSLNFSNRPCPDICNPSCGEPHQVTDRSILIKEAIA